MPGSDDPDVAENRRIRRYVNVTTWQAARTRGDGDVILRHFVCECGRVDCDDLVTMPLGNFELASMAGPVVAHD